MSLSTLRSTSEPVFVNNDEIKKYQCTIHNGIICDPMQTACGHRFCRPCIGSWLTTNENAKCPANEEDCVILSSDGENGTQITPDSSARREILNLKVHCTFKNFGCRNTLTWKALLNHEETCEFKPTECPNTCGKPIIQADLSKHLEECERRVETCEYCHDKLPFNKLKNHQSSECPEVELPCTYQCEAHPLKRRQLQQHLEFCHKKPLRCKFRSAGCRFETRVENHLKRHETENFDLHLDLINSFLPQIEIIKKEMEEAKSQVKVLLEEMIILRRKPEHVQKCHQELTVLKDTMQTFEQRLETGNTRPFSADGGPEVRNRLVKHDQQLGIQDVRLAEMDLRFQIVETASYDGILMWKIREYSRRKAEAVAGKTISLYSQPFYSDRYGYKMCARVYLNGDGMGKGTHVSLFFVVMRGDYDALLNWPFAKKVTLMLLDQEMGRDHLTDSFRPDPTSSSFKRPTSAMNIASGCPIFVSHTTLERRKYLHDDTIFIKFVVSD